MLAMGTGEFCQEVGIDKENGAGSLVGTSFNSLQHGRPAPDARLCPEGAAVWMTPLATLRFLLLLRGLWGTEVSNTNE